MTDTGYTIKAVAARIADMDVDAAGNAEKAAWKRYLALCLMALAKGVEKKAIVEMVFGKGGKASKTFHNMWTLANKCRGHVTGNMAWTDVAVMGVEDAFNATIQMINRHMAVHDVNGKNAYDAVCNMSLEEVAQAKANAEAAKAEADAEAAAKAEAEAAAKAEAEAAAKAANAERPERTAADAAIAALYEASRADLNRVLDHILGRLGKADLEFVHTELGERIANMPTQAEPAAIAA